MAYQYNKFKIKEFAQMQGKSASDLRRITKVSREEVAEKWLEGSIPSCNSICVVADKLGVDLLEFFSKDGRPLSELYQPRTESETGGAKSESEQSMIPTSEHLKEIYELEKAHLRDTMSREVELARKEVEMKDRIRRELKEEFAADKQQIIDSYEDRLTARDAEIGRLRTQLAELTAQYKELEATQKETPYAYMGTRGLAEPSAKRKG